MAIQPTGSSASSISALTASQSDRVASTLRRPAETLTREVESARVRLSAFGQVQSAAANVQAAARNLQDTKQLSSLADVKKAAETFVRSFNDERAALVRVSGNGNAGRPAVAQANDGRAAVASAQLQRTTGEAGSALRDAGIRVERDGSLSVDTKALESAFNANPSAVVKALGDVGRAAEATATRQLAGNGSVGAAVRNLSSQLEQLETRQTALQSSGEASQRAVEVASRRYGFGAVGAGAYLGIFGL